MKVKTWHIVVLGVVAIMLLAPFFTYHFYLAQNGVSDDPEQWGQFGDYVGGLLNPIIGLLTLILTIYIAYYLKKADDDRHASEFEALVIFDTLKFYLVNRDKGKRPRNYYTLTADGKRIAFGLPTYNIGVGTARNVIFNFDFNFGSALNMLEEMNKLAPMNTALKIEKLPEVFKIDGILCSQELKPIQITYIISINHAHTHHNLQIPWSILELYSAYIWLYWIVPTHVKNNYHKFLPINIKATYSDIKGRKSSKRHKIEFLLNSGSATWSEHKIIAE